MATKKKSTAKPKQTQSKEHAAKITGSGTASLPVLKKRQMPWFGWLGLGIIILSEILLYLGNHPIAFAFTSVMWTGYILFLDGWIWQRGGISYFKDKKREWPMLALLSILIWLMFEAYNFKLQNWGYTGLPKDQLTKDFLYFWSFATIIPALFRTTNLFGTFGFFTRSHKFSIKFTPFILAVSFVIGIAFCFLPVMFSDSFAPNLIPFVWVGFIFLMEPINYRLGIPSIYRDIENKDVSFLWQVLAAGLLCGFIWESWNEQAKHLNGAVWLYYVTPFWRALCFNLKYGEMPLIGFLGYPPFIWECYALFEFLKWALQGQIFWKTPAPAK